ncbi:LssY C-terminal domain-containing protein [Humibacter sp. RRB41]|uniref:LssY C-terminal domain-containing protein n=1 Tax=Humibacter sp. RRB41 TaxID=2919946 RepID=UPI001FAAA2BA|nr:LssY C-terminal domain-containing protein [Humibacter sp. RRB41]
MSAGGAESSATGSTGSTEAVDASGEGEREPVKRPARNIRLRVSKTVDYAFFLFGTLAAIWLAWLLITESFSWGWWLILFFVLFWALLAYLVLPRLHSILTRIYVPNYFIGRARTSDGLLGDPINLALLGSQAQVESVMTEAGWTRADPVTLRSSWRIVTSTLLRRSYDEAPVSPLLLFERQQDLAYQQEVRGNPAKRHHVRFWKCPPDWYLPGGFPSDWLGAATFDRSVGLSLFTLQVTHRIDADTDIERDHVVKSIESPDAAVRVSAIRDFSSGYHSRNGGGDSIITDGDLPVIDLRGIRTLPEFDTEPDVVESAADKRPVSIVLGSGLLVLRVIAGVVGIVIASIGWKAYVNSVTIDYAEGEVSETLNTAAAVIALSVSIIAVLVQLGLITLIFRGSNWARLLAMIVSALTVIFAAVDYFNGGPNVNLRANLLGLPLDILVLLALSAEQSSAWARRIRYLKIERKWAKRHPSSIVS